MDVALKCSRRFLLEFLEFFFLLGRGRMEKVWMFSGGAGYAEVGSRGVGMVVRW